MTTQVQFRRGTTSQHTAFIGAEGEITVDTDESVAVVHDGSTEGGHPLARKDFVQSEVTKSIAFMAAMGW